MSNTFPRAGALVLPILAMACQEAATSEQIAISCTGPTEYAEPTIPDIPVPEDGIETRIYVIDEQRKDVAYYNPALGALVYICEDGPERCKTGFYPRWIALQQSPEAGAKRYVAIDRQAGKLTDRLGGEFGFMFSGDCKRTTMPGADSRTAKF